MDEAGLIGVSTMDSIKTSAASNLDRSRAAQAVPEDGILRQIDIEQDYSKRLGV